VMLASRQLSGYEFESWGWRLPILLSMDLLGISTWIRLSMRESPAFLNMKADGKVSNAPLRESLTPRGNKKLVVIALLSINYRHAV
ncbi:MFS transporter, partial [Pseudomonas aeruginosa]